MTSETEDVVLLMGVIAISAILIKRHPEAAASFLRAAAKHGGSAQKADQSNHELLSGVDVVEVERIGSQSGKAQGDEAKEPACNASRVVVESLKRGNDGHQDCLDVRPRLVPVERSSFVRRVCRRVGLWLIAHDGSLSKKDQSTGGAA